MRLTLRTLLAYLDGILEPDDQADLQKKIDESTFASALVYRMRDVVRRPRLSAPKVLGKGMGTDPNTVAEYLDNTLSAERVPDFEKVGLESDVHLAEVGACHQILTLVLGSPAEIDPGLRERMYSMSARSEAKKAAAAVTAAATAPAAKPSDADVPEAIPVAVAIREKPEVPEYLRQGTGTRVWAITATVLLALLLTGLAVILLTGPLDSSHPIAQALGWGEEKGGAADATPPRRSPPAGEPTAEPATATVPTAAETAAAKAAGGAAKTTEPATDVTPAVEAVAPVDDGETPVAPADIVPADVSPDDTAPPAEVPTEPAESAADLAMTKGKATPTAALPAEEPPVAEPGPDEIDEEAPVSHDRVGNFISEDEVLLKQDLASESGWTRLEKLDTLRAGDILMALPAFGPEITLTAGPTLRLASDTMVRLDVDKSGAPVVAVFYGRVIISAGDAGDRVELLLGDRAGVVTFDAAESTLAAEVRRVAPTGKNPESNDALIAADLYVAEIPRSIKTSASSQGRVTWSRGDTRPQVLKGPAHLALGVGAADRAIDATEFPEWISGPAAEANDKRAAPIIGRSLTNEKPVTLALTELAADRRAEVRSLALRCLNALDEFELSVEALKEIDQRGTWQVHIESLQRAIARGPDEAANVRQAFIALRGQKDGTELYRMLWGFTADDLAKGEAATLVDYLDHDSMDYRVLAFHNLKSITGRGYQYRPEYSAVNRQLPLRKWQTDLKDGKITPKAEELTADEEPGGPFEEEDAG